MPTTVITLSRLQHRLFDKIFFPFFKKERRLKWSRFIYDENQVCMLAGLANLLLSLPQRFFHFISFCLFSICRFFLFLPWHFRRFLVFEFRGISILASFVMQMVYDVPNASLQNEIKMKKKKSTQQRVTNEWVLST